VPRTPASPLRVALLLVAILALSGGGALWALVRSVPEEHQVRTAVVFRQGPASVWAVATDWAGQDSWRSDAEAVEALEPVAGRPAFRLLHPDGGHTDATVLSWNAPRSFTLRIDGPELQGTWTIDLVRAGLGTGVVVTERGRIEPALRRLVTHRTGALGAPARAFLADLAARMGEEAEVLTAPADVAALTGP